MAGAQNYYRWILERFAPYLGRHIVEIGSGVGTFAQLLLQRTKPETLLLVEPASNLFPMLRERFEHEPRITLVEGYAEDIPAGASSDCIILVNVLEHIAEPQALLGLLQARLVPGGRLLLFVPAGPWLFGSLDRAFGHHRRYTAPTLAASLRAAGLHVSVLHYMNLPGALPWFFAGKILRKRTLSRRNVQLYDAWIVPWISTLESRWRPPFGQGLVAIAEKPR